MDDEATHLLREIRDISLRAEGAAKRFRRAWVIVLIAALCAIGFLIVRLDGLITEAEHAIPPAADQK